jgi:hypothetical protein
LTTPQGIQRLKTFFAILDEISIACKQIKPFSISNQHGDDRNIIIYNMIN